MNKKLSFDDHYEQWLLLIAKGTRQNNLIAESWKKGKKIQDLDWERNFKLQTIIVKFDLL